MSVNYATFNDKRPLHNTGAKEKLAKICLIENKISMAELASKLTAQIPGKPESDVMMNIEDNQYLMFAGVNQPCALVNLKSLNRPKTTTTDFSYRLCDFINTQTGIDISRVT